DEIRQERVAIRELDGRQRAREQRAGVARHLRQHAEQLAERAEALVELLLHVADQQLVLLEGRLELLAARLLGGLLPLRRLEQLRLLALARLVFPQALLMLAVVASLPLSHQIDELLHGRRLILRLRRAPGDCEAER